MILTLAINERNELDTSVNICRAASLSLFER